MSNHNQHNHSATNNISTAFFLNLLFTIIEFFGAFYTNSLAIMSDAIHDLGDSLSLGMSWYFQKISTKKATKIYSYGFKRFSLLGAIINSIILLIGSFFVIYKAIPRIINPEESDAKGMMWFAILGIIINGAAVLKLTQGKSLNERVVTLHLLEDVLGWVAVLIASIVMQFWDIPILDPLLSLAIAFFILFNIYKNGKESIRIILQGAPIKISLDDIRDAILKNKNIKSLQDSHLWTMDGEQNVFTAHLILVDTSITSKESLKIKQDIKAVLLNKFQLEHITLEIVNLEDSEYIDCVSSS
ncbi:cation diffusion facilitator family transporter [Polaribacter sp.]|uniref:cation diffusion facilitator family transporter n=1 Tax=Polaribacter sp. TaxID=1920175 RepID=UPI003F6A8436